MTAPRDKSAPHDRQRWVEATNTGSQEIPAWGAVEIAGSVTDSDSPGRVYLQVKRPTSSNVTPAAFNSSMSIAVGGYGAVTLDFPVYVLYDSANTPANGEEWGIKKDAFTLEKGGVGYKVLGDIDSDRTTMRVMDAAGEGEPTGCDFVLTEALSESDQTASAKIVESWPVDNPDAVITVYNMPSSITDGGYHWKATNAANGRAYYDATNDRYAIVEMDHSLDECGGGSGGFDAGSDCSFFVAGATPRVLICDVIGFADQSCSDCPEVFDAQVLATQIAGNPCNWNNTIGVTGSCASWTSFSVYMSGVATNWTMTLDFLQGGTVEHRFSAQGTSLIDGRTMDLTATLVSDNATDCDSTNATIRVRGQE